MKKAIIIGGLILTIIVLVLVSGCSHDKETSDTPAPSTPSQPSSINKDVVPKPVGCGDKICDEKTEGCDMSTYNTICPEDCSIKCGPRIEFSKASCEGSCSVSGDTITVKGDSKIKIILTNTGERSTDLVSSNFKCDYDDGSLYFKTELGDKNGYRWDDYFEAKNLEEESVASKLNDDNDLDYILELKGSTESARKVNCRTSFSSTSFNTAQIVRYSLDFK